MVTGHGQEATKIYNLNIDGFRINPLFSAGSNSDFSTLPSKIYEIFCKQSMLPDSSLDLSAVKQQSGKLPNEDKKVITMGKKYYIFKKHI